MIFIWQWRYDGVVTRKLLFFLNEMVVLQLLSRKVYE